MTDDRAPFLLQLRAPRPTFAFDLTDEEAALMGEHAAYWTGSHGDALVAFGPVLDPSGSWGLAVVEATSVDEVQGWAAEDPAVTSGMCTVEVHAMGPSRIRPLA